MLATRQYSIDRVELAWQGISFKEGLAAGTSVTEARNSVGWTQKPRGNGGTVQTYNPDESGVVSIVVDMESQLHQTLLTLASADRANRNIVGPMTLNDTSSGAVTVYESARIQNEPDETRGTESGTVTWVFITSKIRHIPAIPLTNVAGG